MSFKSKLMLMFGGVLLASYVMLGVLFVSYMKSDTSYSEAIASANDNLSLLADLSSQILLKQSNTRGYMINESEDFLVQRNTIDAQVTELLNQIEHLELNEEQLQQISSLTNLMNVYDKISSQSVVLIKNNQRDEAITLLADGTGLFKQITALLDEMNASQNELVTGISNELSEDM